MFTGIIAEVGKVIQAGYGRLTIAAGEILGGLKLGDSISVNGVCLTVTDITAGSFSVDVMSETLVRTNLDNLNAGDRVNLEKPLSLGGPMGGHLVQGHIDAVGTVASISWSGTAMLVKFNAPGEVMRYVVQKGFIAVDGISLTVVSRDSGSFQVSVVDYSRKHTILGDIRVGDTVNLEVDIIAKYVEQLGQARQTGVTANFLREHGFITS